MRSFRSLLPRLLTMMAVAALCTSALFAQQTLGGITGDVTDPSGSVIPGATVTVLDEQTALSRAATSNGAGTYSFVNLPIGSYTVTFAANGFETQKTPHITVQGNRTATLNAQLKVASAGQTIEVDATPLMNAVDTTNGYVMDKTQIDTVPLARAVSPASPRNRPASTLSCPAAPAQIPGWAMHPSGPMASVIPRTASS